MKTNQKQEILKRLRAYVEKKGSQTAAINSMNDISQGTLSNVLNGRWENIDDAMWRAIATYVGGLGKKDAWITCETDPLKRMFFILEETQEGSIMVSMIGEAGIGKTEAIRQYALTHRNVYHICCSGAWSRRYFIEEVAHAMGLSHDGGTIQNLMDRVKRALRRKESPLVVLDEADKLSDTVFYDLINFYNDLEGYCGLALVATKFLKKRIERGLRLEKKGYEEIYSRIGRRYLHIEAPSDEDIARICVANGINDLKEIQTVADEADCDLRRVNRKVWSLQKKHATEKKKAAEPQLVMPQA